MNGSSPRRRGVLLCEECGQRTVIEEPLSVWSLASHPSGCACSERSTRVNRPDEGQGRGEAGSVTNPLGKPGPPRPGTSLR